MEITIIHHLILRGLVFPHFSVVCFGWLQDITPLGRVSSIFLHDYPLQKLLIAKSGQASPTAGKFTLENPPPKRLFPFSIKWLSAITPMGPEQAPWSGFWPQERGKMSGGLSQGEWSVHESVRQSVRGCWWAKTESPSYAATSRIFPGPPASWCYWDS